MGGRVGKVTDKTGGRAFGGEVGVTHGGGAPGV